MGSTTIKWQTTRGAMNSHMADYKGHKIRVMESTDDKGQCVLVRVDTLTDPPVKVYECGTTCARKDFIDTDPAAMAEWSRNIVDRIIELK